MKNTSMRVYTIIQECDGIIDFIDTVSEKDEAVSILKERLNGHGFQIQGDDPELIYEAYLAYVREEMDNIDDELVTMLVKDLGQKKIKLSELAKQDKSNGGRFFLYECPETGEYIDFEDLPDYVIDDRPSKKKFMIKITHEQNIEFTTETDEFENEIDFQEHLNEVGIDWKYLDKAAESNTSIEVIPVRVDSVVDREDWQYLFD
jgi:hypothetical protein